MSAQTPVYNKLKEMGLATNHMLAQELDMKKRAVDQAIRRLELSGVIDHRWVESDREKIHKKVKLNYIVQDVKMPKSKILAI